MKFLYKKRNQRGFTLIELLIVMVIIGILATIILASTSNARKKGADGAIKQELASLRSQAELYFNENNFSYNNVFTGNNTWASATVKIQEILTAINSKTTVHTAGSSVNAWAAQAQSKLDPTQYFCSSSAGLVKVSSTAMGAGATVCPP